MKEVSCAKCPYPLVCKIASYTTITFLAYKTIVNIPTFYKYLTKKSKPKVDSIVDSKQDTQIDTVETELDNINVNQN